MRVFSRYVGRFETLMRKHTLTKGDFLNAINNADEILIEETRCKEPDRTYGGSGFSIPVNDSLPNRVLFIFVNADDPKEEKEKTFVHEIIHHFYESVFRRTKKLPRFSGLRHHEDIVEKKTQLFYQAHSGFVGQYYRAFFVQRS